MKMHTTQQEILLVTATTLTQKGFCERKAFETNDYLLPDQQLEQACWNGFLDELFSEITQQSTTDSKLLIWHIRHGESLLQIQLSESSVMLKKQSSIDPYFFCPLCWQLAKS